MRVECAVCVWSVVVRVKCGVYVLSVLCACGVCCVH